MSKPNPMGSTFAERKAAREGKSFEPVEQPETGNSTFAERSGKPTKPAAKQVDDAAEQVEDKAVAPAETKRAARKS